jgi:hypothetical protein
VIASERDLGAEVVFVQELTDDALGLPRGRLVGGVDEQPRAVAGDQRPVAEARAGLLVEAKRAQPLAEAEAVVGLVEIDLDAPFLPAGLRSALHRPAGYSSSARASPCPGPPA